MKPTLWQFSHPPQSIPANSFALEKTGAFLTKKEHGFLPRYPHLLDPAFSEATEYIGKRCYVLVVAEHSMIMTRHDLFFTIRLIEGRLIIRVLI